MRLVAQAKMGYYPTPPKVTEIICNYVQSKTTGTIRVFDPCAGEGVAIYNIGQRLEAETYGIEIDLDRGAQAQGIMTKCLVTDYKSSIVSRQAFSLLFLNPPYDWTAKRDETEASERLERTFLRDCATYLCPGGILVYLIPQKRLDARIAAMLSYRFEDVEVFRFPEKEYEAFQQIVVFGKAKKKPEHDAQSFEYLKSVGQFTATVPFLPETPSRMYHVPASPNIKQFIFRTKHIDPAELAEEVIKHGLFDRFTELSTPLLMTERIRPIMPLRHGHLAQVLACGLMNGVVWNKEGRDPLLVKGVTKKEVTQTIEHDGDVEKTTETDHIKITINAFNSEGQLLTIK